MDTIAISEFKATCLKLLDKVKNTGQPLLVTKKGIPVALVSPPPPAHLDKKSYFGCMAGTGEIVGDIISPAADEEEWEVLKS